MNVIVAPSIFESINARALTPAQVAATFVPSRKFAQIAKRRNTVVIGPRGSGKTTLLKMLQQSALENWVHQKADEFRSAIDFTGIFVPTDLAWSEQLRNLANGKLDPPEHQLFSSAAFTTHLLKAIVVSFISRVAPNSSAATPFRRVSCTPVEEAFLVKSLARAWRISNLLPSFLSLKHALSLRMIDIFERAQQEIVLGTQGRSARLAADRFLHIHPIRAASAAVELFDDTLGISGQKWALLLDELELAPEWITEMLLGALRSTEGDKLLFKLALNPVGQRRFVGHDDLQRKATVGQDFEEVALFYPEKRDAYEFCSALWYQMLDERKIHPKPPEQVLGHSIFETHPLEKRDFKTAYKRGSQRAEAFIDLASKDPSFRTYITDSLGIKKLEPNTLESLSSVDRAAKVRKIAPLVAMRDFFWRDPGKNDDRRFRSRKNAALYAGAQAIFAISEGNPRWFIGLVGRLLDNWENQRERISREIQAREIEAASDRFAALLHTIPISSFDKGLLGVVTQVGEFFFQRTVRAPFSADPPGSFRVDTQIPSNIVEGLKQAISAGAIVYVPDGKGSLVLDNIFERRFRLSYLLAPLYDVPLRLGGKIALSNILYGIDERQLTFAEGNIDESASDKAEE
jgi:hypothetical protein